MKKIINGKVYNTETATMLAYWDNGYLVNDVNRVEKVLYRTKRLRYFLYIMGGPATCYAKRKGTNWCAGYEIVALDAKQARAWGEKYMDVDSYIKEFGEVEEA